VNLVYVFRQPDTEANAYLMQSSVARSSVQQPKGEPEREQNQTRRSNKLKSENVPISHGLAFATRAAISRPLIHFSHEVLELSVESITDEI